MKKSLIFFTVLLSFFFVGCASQRDVFILDERLMILERQNQELQQQTSSLQRQISKELERFGQTNQSAETSLRTQYAGMNADMEKMQQDLQLLSGRLDEISYKLERKPTATGDLKKPDDIGLQLARIDQRVTLIERHLNMAPGASTPSTPSTQGSAVPISPGTTEPKQEATAEQMYNDGKQAFDDGHMDKARQFFQQLLNTYPQSEHADNAQFWIGETYYSEKWYEKAILEYQTVIEKYATGNKVAGAMLKQGMAFLQLGDKANARLIWKALEKKFPSSNEAKIATTKLKET
jgi:tol-pal system protein YbgF